ncbi:glycosyltransferase family 1 protein [Sphingomonas sediminicola]|uniref:glycosyltransferase family 4 protein n=1 Tax=Sphingomonas sediminicola TaxID=386874 RepID=UPI003CECF549
MRPSLSIRLGLSVEAVEPELTGIGRYSLELARRLPRHSSIRSLTLFRGLETLSDVETLTRMELRRRRGHRLVSQVSRALARHRINLFHGPNYFLPDWAEQGVVTVHDLSVFRFPELHPTERVSAFERGLRASIDRASHLITDCETIRREVIDFTGFSPDHVTAIPLGVSSNFQLVPAEVRQAVLARHGLPAGGYGLTLSSFEPRKRIASLLRAWRLLPRPVRDRIPLAIAGASGWKNETLHDEIREGTREGWVIPLGFVPDEDLPALYSGSTLFVFPSIYEGFGLPPLEAMASGVPTMVASSSCLEEVTKGAAMLCQPDDIDAFADDIARALEDEPWRQRAISAGIQVVKDYTWERCVDETVGVYQQVMGKLADR